MVKKTPPSLAEELSFASFKEVVCPLCQSQRAELVFVIEVGGREVSNLVRCEKCGLIYLNPQPEPDKLGALYQDYDEFKKRFHRAGKVGEHTLSQLHRYRRQVREIGKLISPGRILDIGCAFGGFLSLAKERGWETYGVEVSPGVAEEARKRGHQIFTGGAKEASYSNSFFDVIILSHILEHLSRPVETLLNISPWLKSKGFLAVYTPNANSYWYRLLDIRRRMNGLANPLIWLLKQLVGRDKNVMIDVEGAHEVLKPRRDDQETLVEFIQSVFPHLCLFDCETLRDCLARSGFTVVKQTTGSVELPSSRLKRLIKNRAANNLLGLVGWQEELSVYAKKQR